MSVDLRWQIVECCECGKRYRCTPDSDFYHDPDVIKTRLNGRCWRCHLLRNGLDGEQPEPKADPLITAPGIV